MSALARGIFALALSLATAAASAATLSASPTSVPVGGSTVTAAWSAIASPSSTDWIGIYTPGSPDQGSLAWRYTTGAASGSVPFTIPASLPIGTYELRLFANNGYTRLATSNSLVVTGGSLSASPTLVAPGADVTANWSGIPSPTTTDWIGLYTPTGPNNPSISWRYTTGAASGSVPFTIPAGLASGSYQLRLFSNNGYTLLAVSNGLTVGATVSGTVTLNGAPLAGVAFTGTNGAACTSSNTSGAYTCTVPSGWSGSVTPTLAAHSFTPGSRTYTNVTASQTAQNYTAVLNPKISGTVTLFGAPLSGVSFAGTNGAVCSASNAAGQYSCDVPPGWSGEITPSVSGYSFTPASRPYTNVTADQAAQDYPVLTYQVSGAITSGTLPLGGVVLTATNGASCTASNASGQYACAVLAGWSGTITPSLTGYTFTPPNRNYTSIGANQAAQDFSATLTAGSTPIFFIHVDHLNTPRLIADSTGTTVWRWDNTEPFGGSVPDENPSGLGLFEFPLAFEGQYRDKETGLHQNAFRDYWSEGGRYIQSDPIGLRGGLNTYAYVSSNPLSLTDPFGLAYFAKRALRGMPWLGPASCNPIDDYFNTEISHEQLFFEDGKSPSNMGFFSDGTLKEEPNPMGYRCKSGQYDDCIMRKAAANTPPPPNYCIIGRNCQTWTDRVKKEYARLAKDPQVQIECGVCK
jgi:RHS repeat-associated protein